MAGVTDAATSSRRRPSTRARIRSTSDGARPTSSRARGSRYGPNVASMARSGASVLRPSSDSDNHAHPAISSDAGSRAAARAPARTSPARRPADSGGVAIGIAPSPISPASRRSSGPCPATWMGTSGRRGAKRNEHSGPHEYGPSACTVSPRRRLRTISTAARVRSTRSDESSPATRASSGCAVRGRALRARPREDRAWPRVPRSRTDRSYTGSCRSSRRRHARSPRRWRWRPSRRAT